MRIVLISDTHMAHASLVVPPCDVLVHAGDFSRRGRPEELQRFAEWMAQQPASAKVFVAGNHDHVCEREPELVRATAARHGLIYLEDETVETQGLRIHGSPITPAFRAMAFNRARGEAIARHWERIPIGVDLLVTHGPPAGLGDRTFTGYRAGCESLRDHVRRAAPKLHVFGHIHEAFGEYADAEVGTRFLNVCSRPLVPLTVRAPVVLDV